MKELNRIIIREFEFYEEFEKWYKESLKIEAKKYKTKVEFRNKNSKAYRTALRIDKIKPGFFNEITKHMEILRQKKWNYENLLYLAKKFKSRNEFYKNVQGAYKAAHKLGIMDDITQHMEVKRIKWNQELLDRTIDNYENYTQFRKESPSGIKWAQTHGLGDYVKNKFQEKGGAGNIKWEWNLISKEAKKHNNIMDFRIKSHSAYQSARRHGLLDKVKELYNFNFQSYG